MVDQDDREEKNSVADILKEKMLYGMRQVRKCETGKNGQNLFMRGTTPDTRKGKTE